MKEMIIDILNQYGYLGVFLLIAIENIFPPIPSEVILTFGGFMTTFTTMTISGVVLFSTIGSIVGAVVLYGVGRLLSVERLEKWLDSRLGRALHLKKEDVRKAEGWFVKRGPITVFLCRFIPIIRSLISIPAGMAKMSFGLFVVLTAIGTSIWNIILVYLGAVAGSAWDSIAGYIDTYSYVVLVLLVFAFLVGCGWFYLSRNKKN